MIKNDKSASVFGKMKNLLSVDFNNYDNMIACVDSYKKSILYMSDSIIISQEIQVVDSTYRGNIPQSTDGKNIDIINPFNQVSNVVLLKYLLKKDNEEPEIQHVFSNPLENSFSFKGILIKNINVPPKLIFIKNKDDQSDNLQSIQQLKEVAKKVIIGCEIKNKVGAIGMNYKLYLDNNNNKYKLNEKILNPNITSNFESCNAVISKKIDAFTMLNLTIANATIQNLDKKINAIYIDANFHTDIFGSNTFEDTMEKDFYKHLSNAIDLIFGK